MSPFGYDPAAVGRRFILVATGLPVGLVILACTVFLIINPGTAMSNSVLTGLRGAAPALDNQNHLYVLDGWGGVHPVGAAPALSTSASWPTRDIAFSLGLFPD